MTRNETRPKGVLATITELLEFLNSRNDVRKIGVKTGSWETYLWVSGAIVPLLSVGKEVIITNSGNTLDVLWIEEREVKK